MQRSGRVTGPGNNPKGPAVAKKRGAKSQRPLPRLPGFLPQSPRNPVVDRPGGPAQEALLPGLLGTRRLRLLGLMHAVTVLGGGVRRRGGVHVLRGGRGGHGGYEERERPQVGVWALDPGRAL